MKNKKKEVTIYDVAQALSVSPTTVSRALKDHFSIGKDTTKAVKKMAEKMGYRPNTLAAGLRSNKTNTIGVIISWIDRPFISSLIGGIEEAANEADYNVIITQSNDSYEKEVANTNTLYNSRVGG
jgi:LacI family transcriptional regulator